MPDASRGIDDGIRRSRRTDQVESPRARGTNEVAIPLLALLAQIYRLKEIGARMTNVSIPNCAEVWNRDLFDWWRLEEQEAYRRMSSVCIALHLLQRRMS